MAIDLNPTLFGRKVFPSAQRTGELLGRFGQSAINAITPAAGTPPPTMAGVSVPPAGASLGQLQFTGPLINTSRFNQQAAPQPAQPAFNYGTYAATMGLPAFDVTKTQTPSATQNQINTAALTGQTSPLNFSTQSPFSAPKAIPTQSTPMAGFARVSDWSQNPLVQAARATGNISAIERATAQAKSQGRGVFQPNDISAVSLASLRASNPEAGFGGSRTPEQQQALLAQMRIQGAETMRKNLAEQESIIAQRRANPELYTTPSGSKIAAPTNMFGQPIESWKSIYQKSSLANEAALAKMRSSMQPATQTASTESGFNLRGVGGVTMPFGTAALSGGPQPSTGFGAGSITRPTQYSNARAEQRKEIRQLANAYGLPRPLSVGVENQYRQEFSRMGLLG